MVPFMLAWTAQWNGKEPAVVGEPLPPEQAARRSAMEKVASRWVGRRSVLVGQIGYAPR